MRLFRDNYYLTHIYMARTKAGRSKRTMRPRKSGVATKNYVKKQINKNQEFKKEDLASANLIGPTIQPAAITGVLASARDGQVINIRSILLRFNISLQTSLGLDILPYMRFMIFTWFPRSVPTLADVLENITSGHIVISPINQTNTRQLKVHYDKVFNFGRQFRESVHVSYYKRGNQKLRFDDAGSTPVGTGITYILTVSSEATTANQPNLVLFRRTTYTDS